MLAVSTAALLAACGGSGTPDVVVRDAAIGATRGDLAALYAVLENRGDGDDAVVAATCTCAARVTLHGSDGEEGFSMMVRTEQLDVPAGATTRLDPGGSHLMLDGMGEPLVEGDRVQVEIELERGAPISLEVPVVAPQELSERVAR